MDNRITMNLFRIVTFLGFLGLAFAPQASASGVQLTEFTLANDLRLIVIPDRGSQVVTHSVWYRVGAADEETGKTGLAHFLEHLMFKGTRKFPYGDFDRLMDENGAEGNAFTTQDATVYYQQTTADRLPLMMELESDRMQNLVLTDQIVAPELQVVREERRNRVESDPMALLREQVDAALFTAHPYGRPVIGWMSDVAKLTKEDAINFYRKHYTPANAVVVVAGDVDPYKVKYLAEQHYGLLKNSFTPQKRERTPEPVQLVARRLSMKDTRAATPSFSRTYLAPGDSIQHQNESLSLQFFAKILGGSTSSRLYKALVIDQKLASHAGAAYDSSSRDYGRLIFFVSPLPAASLENIEKAMDDVIMASIAQELPALEIESARKQALAERVYGLDSQLSIVWSVGTTVINDNEAAAAFDTMSWNHVTPSSIKAAASKYLKPENAATAILLPE
jgi:zinc protease